jgi:predicted HTH domain antitoxin
MLLELKDELFVNKLNGQLLLTEVVIQLYKTRKLTAGKCADLLGLHLIQFQKLLADRKMPINYDIADLEKDLENLKFL